jgi:Catechol dioxygenase N terminus
MASNSQVLPMKDLTIDNITGNVHAINSTCGDVRLKYLLERAVSHLHDFARETRLSTNEWMAALLFLTKVGQICTAERQVYFKR